MPGSCVWLGGSLWGVQQPSSDSTDFLSASLRPSVSSKVGSDGGVESETWMVVARRPLKAELNHLVCDQPAQGRNRSLQADVDRTWILECRNSIRPSARDRSDSDRVLCKVSGNPRKGEIPADVFDSVASFLQEVQGDFVFSVYDSRSFCIVAGVLMILRAVHFSEVLPWLCSRWPAAGPMLTNDASSLQRLDTTRREALSIPHDVSCTSVSGSLDTSGPLWGMKGSSRFFVCRHGESEANVLGIVSSTLSVASKKHGLSPHGRAQVEETAASLVRLLPQNAEVRIVSSPFLRAQETAEILHGALLGSSLTVDERLRERYFGEFDGQSANESYNRVWRADAQNADHTEWGVESANACRSRGAELVAALNQVDGSCVPGDRQRIYILCSHGDTLQLLQTAFAGVCARRHRLLLHLCTAGCRELYFSSNFYDGLD